MAAESRQESLEPATRSHSGATLLATGGLTAAVGAASCCAIPLLLGAVGLGGTWLGFVGLVAGPYQVVLLVTAVALLVSGGIILWRHSAVVCAPGQTCTSSRSSIGTTITLSLGAILVALSIAFV